MAQAYNRIGTAAEVGNFDQTLVAAQAELVAQQMFPIDQVITVVNKARQTGRISSVVQLGAQTLAPLSESATAGMGEASAALATTARTITQAAKGRDIFVTLLANETGTGPDEGELIDTLGKAAAKDYTSTFMALAATEPGGLNVIGAAGTPLTYASHFLPAFQRLAVGQVAGRKNWIIPVTGIADLGGEAQFSEWQKLGSAWLDADVEFDSGYLGIAPWRVRCWFVTDYTTSGGADYGLMLAQSAIKMEVVMNGQIKISTEDYLVNDSALKIGYRRIYGINGTRDTAGTNAGCVAVLR